MKDFKGINLDKLRVKLNNLPPQLLEVAKSSSNDVRKQTSQFDDVPEEINIAIAADFYTDIPKLFGFTYH